jgi:hypothetical protein
MKSICCPSVYKCIPLPLLGNNSVNTFPRQRINATIEEMLDASFYMWSVTCVYPYIVARQRLGKHVPAATKNC